jgi:hypothetical protein
MKYILYFFLAISFTFSCKNAEHKHTTDGDATEQKVDKSGPEYTSKYICPMHCKGSGSDTTGVCPVCKMDYVLAKEDHDHEGHDHEGHDHEGHDHKEEHKH